ncbi:LOW QUALITY PROTEIN: inactive phospholipase C-like protein 2 [Alosa sapidissima]|nr:LOW QUALITY PROTEIN: inactive phospholipase C-like protein 2 [Alosa sapidissima]
MAEHSEEQNKRLSTHMNGFKAMVPNNKETHVDTGVSNGGCEVTKGQRDAEDQSPEVEPARVTELKEDDAGIPRRSSIIKDGSRRGRDRKKTVSFGGMPGSRKISSVSGCLSRMQEGSELRKLRPGLRLYSRYYLLEADQRTIRWEPSKKDPGKARLPLAEVREVRTGRNTDVFRASGVAELVTDDCAFSLVYGDDYDTLDLVASSPEVANIWVTGLRYLISQGAQGSGTHTHPAHTLTHTRARAAVAEPGREEEGRDDLQLSWLSKEFSEMVAGGGRPEKDGDWLSVSEATDLIEKLSPGVRSSHVQTRLRELLRGDGHSATPPHTPPHTPPPHASSSHVSLQHFTQAFHDVSTRPEIYFLLVQFSASKDFLDTRDVMRFLETEQGVALASEDSAQAVIDRYEPSPLGRQLGRLSLSGFTRFLDSSECCVFDPLHVAVCEDMSRPLPHYYISSSHNTHVTEAQVPAVSGIGGYERALRLGCRCLELDVWEGPHGRPAVSKGHTHSAIHTHAPPLAFREVVQTVAKMAFLTSEYPLILCLENHCSVAQQRIMVRDLQEAFGERLHRGLLGNEDGCLPSPHDLRGKVLLLGNRPFPEPQHGEAEEITQKAAGAGGTSSLSSRRVPLCPELSALIALCHADPPPNNEFPSSPAPSCVVTCFREALASRHAAERGAELVELTKRRLLRVRPSLMRVDSSNPDPLAFWKAGLQMVALNVQTDGTMLNLHRGWFQRNGACGYTLRPAIMRQQVAYFSANERGALPGVPPQTLHLRVISGRCLPKPRGGGAKGDVLDPYVTVAIHGIPADCAERRTNTVPQNGESPVFDQSFQFQVNLPELALLRFVVLDDFSIGDDFIGQYTLPLDCVQSGFRHVPLLSAEGEELPHARLLVHVAMTERRGGGKAHKRGLSVRKGWRSRHYTQLQELGLRALDDVFKNAAQPLRDATDLRENMQESLEAFKEMCGVSVLANITQCVLTLGSRVTGSEEAPLLLFDLSQPYPTMHQQGALPDALRKITTVYHTMMQASKAVMEESEGVHSKILQTHHRAMEFHEHLQTLAGKEGIKGRKLNRAVESFSWNITILKGQADLLKHEKAEVQELLKQLNCAAQTANLSLSPNTVKERRANQDSSDGGLDVW